MEANKNTGDIRIVIAGGGTGGHIFPAIAIANALKRQVPGIDILFVGAKAKMEMEKVPKAGYKIEGLDIAGFIRGSVTKNLRLPFKLINSFLQVRQIINSFRPHAVIGVGGYSSYPVLRYAQSKRIPTFIHESNSFAGKSNMLLGKKATKIFVAGEGMGKFFPENKLMVTGNPVRKEIVASIVKRKEALRFFNLDETKKTILVIGGSLGAKSINDAVADGLNEFEKEKLQLIWQTGKHNADKYEEAGKEKTGIWVNEFIQEMEIAYAAADIVVARAGAMTVSELCVVKKPVVFVPYPHAAEDHQTVNAQQLADQNAALIVKDAMVMQELVPEVISLAKNDLLQQQLTDHIGRLSVTNADEIIAAEIIKRIG